MRTFPLLILLYLVSDPFVFYAIKYVQSYPIVELDVQRSRLTRSHHLNNLGSTRGTMPYIPRNKAWCWSKRF